MERFKNDLEKLYINTVTDVYVLMTKDVGASSFPYFVGKTAH